MKKLAPEEKKEPVPRNIHRVQAAGRVGDGPWREIGYVMRVNDDNPEALKATKNRPDRREILLLKQMFEPIGKVEEIPRKHDCQTPDLCLKYGSYSIPIEVKFVERENIADNLNRANTQIEAYGGPDTLGIICLIFRDQGSCPSIMALSEQEHTSPFDGADRITAMKFLLTIRDTIIGKRRLVLLFPMLPVGFCSYFDSFKTIGGYFQFKPEDIDKWLARLELTG